MKNKLLSIITTALLYATPLITQAQAPTLGTCAEFELFSTTGALLNTGISQVTGHVGSNNGSSTGFGNVNGNMYNNNPATAQAASDLLIAYNQLNATIPLFFPSTTMGNGDTLNASIYETAGATTLTGDLYLDGQGSSVGVFIIRIQGPLSAAANSKVKLINGALACNVYWKVEGLVSLAPGTSMKGTIVANNAAIDMSSNDTLEGRALTTAGAITINGVLAYTPVGCGSTLLTGPGYPNLASTECYAIFSGNGACTNAGTTTVTGDIGTNVGLTTGFSALDVTGTIHPIPDASTAACATDLTIVYNYLNSLAHDIELMYPAQFGNNLVLTPHTYLLNGATTFTDTLYLNAMGNPNAVFVIHINGALATSTFANVILTNGALAKNVFWKVDGAVDINDSSIINGTIIANNGAVSINNGSVVNGRAFTTTGNMSANTNIVTIPPGCFWLGTSPVTVTLAAATVYPNPFTSVLTIDMNDETLPDNTRMHIYNLLGEELLVIAIQTSITAIPTDSLSPGMYFYSLTSNNTLIQTGCIISQQ